MESNAHRLIGTQLGTCKLKQLIGFGGMGIVFLARQIRPSRDVAVKVLLSRDGGQTEGKQEFLARFRREADVIAQLDHVNILPIYEYGEQNGLAYLVTPYLEGGSLRDLLAKRAPLSAQEALTYTEQAAAALDYAHKHNIIHRDVKPGNMLFHADGRLVLVDFGIARIMRNTGEKIESTLTSTGQFLGSVTYMAPEMVRGKQPDHRADIYELGVVLFEMLTGRAPFQGTSAFMIAAQHIQEEPPSLTSLNPNITPQVDAVVQKALAKDPDQRYSHANELALALRQALGMPTHIVPSPITPIYSLIDTASLPGGTIAVEAEQLQSRPAFSYPPNLTPRPEQVTPPNQTPRPAAALQPNMQRPIEPTTAQREQPLPPAPDDTTSDARLPQNIYTPPITRPPQNPYMPQANTPPQNPYIPPATTQRQTTRGQLKGVAVVGIIVFFLTAVILFGMQTLRSSTSSSQTPTSIVSVPTRVTSPIATTPNASTSQTISTAPTSQTISTAPTPQMTPTPSPAQQAQDTIQRYYDDVNQADYKDAYQIWGTNYQQGHPYDQYAAGYATTQHVDIVFHSNTALANGSQQVDMTIYARSTTANGSKISAFEGYYIVGQENGAWHLLTYQFVAK